MSVQILGIVVFSHDGRARELPSAAWPRKRRDRGIQDREVGAGRYRRLLFWCQPVSGARGTDSPLRFVVRRSTSTRRGSGIHRPAMPGSRAQSSEDCFVELGDLVATPAAAALRQTTNTKGLVSLLSNWSGISDNIHEPLPGQTRPPIQPRFDTPSLLLSASGRDHSAPTALPWRR